MYGSTTVPYWYSDAKGPDGNWLVLLHGLGVDSSVWEPYLEELISRYNVVLLDLPGHGDNRSPFSLDSAAKQVITIMAQRNIGVITVVGHCIGGCVAQAFASTYSEHCRELILIDTFPLGGEQYNYASFKWLSAVSPLMIRTVPGIFRSPHRPLQRRQHRTTCVISSDPSAESLAGIQGVQKDHAGHEQTANTGLLFPGALSGRFQGSSDPHKKMESAGSEAS